MALCACDSGGGNLGRPTCYSVFGAAKKLIFVEYFKEDGSVNGIDISTDLSSGVLDQTFLDGKIGNLDTNLRWYVTPELKNVVDERADDITEEFNDTSSIFIQEGARSFEGFTIKGDPVFVGNMKLWRCQTSGVFAIDKDGNLEGAEVVDGILYPVRLQDDSLSASYIKPTDTTGAKTSIKFVVSQLENDEDLRMILASNITADLTGAKGLVDVNAEAATGISTTGFTVQLFTTYGGMISKQAAEGLLTADFSGAEITPTPGTVTITSVTESLVTPGEYVFVIVAETIGDLLRFGNKTSGDLDKGLDINDFDVTIV